ncbi:MAG: hypothetical protein AAGI37_19725 [Planctomycetota bacterium]
MQEHPQKLAIKQLSELRSLILQIGSAASSATEPEQIRDLSRLLNQSKARLARSKVEQNLASLTPKQLEAFDAWESGDYGLVGCCGTNRSGKSFVASTIYARYLRDSAPNNSEHLCVTTEQRLSAKNQQKMLWENIPHDQFDIRWTGPKNGFGSRNPTAILGGPDRNVVVHFMTQSEFESNLHAFEGLTIETAWVDETVSHELFSAIKTRLTLSDDGRMLVSSIPGADWYWEVIYNAKPEDGVWYKLFEPFDNPLMTAEKWAELEKSVPPHEREMRLKGVPALAGSLVYVEFNDADHVVAPKDIPYHDLTWYAGMDIGMDHPTVWLLLGVSRGGLYYVVDEYASRNLTPQQDVPGILAIKGSKILRTSTFIDPSAFHITKANPISTGQQYRNAGLPVTPSRRTSGVGEMNQVYQIKEMLRCGELMVSENCPQLIKEFHVWKYNRDRQNKPLSRDAFEDRNNDALDALRYCLTMNPVYVDSNKPRGVEVFYA